MAEEFNNKALRGSVPQILLNALVSGDKYGYEICKDIEQKSNGKLLLKQPSLYSSLRRMEGQGLITSYWADSELGGRRHYYSITEKGRKHYEKKQVNWDEFGDLINALPNAEEKQESSTTKQQSKPEQANTKPQVETTTTNTQTKDFGVVKQENLFNISKTPIIKEDQNSDNSGETFIQFDMFDQKPNFIKTTAETEEVFSTFKSKYSEIATNSIEPDSSYQKTEEDVVFEDDLQEQEDIVDETETAQTNADEQIDDTTVAEDELENISLDNQESIDDIIDVETFDEDIDEPKAPELVAPVYPENNISNAISNKDFSNIKQPDTIIDSSANYSRTKRDFDTYSFTDKQQEEKFVSTGKFAYSKNSENIYGSDFSEIERESLKSTLSEFLNEEEKPEEKQTNDISSLFKFSNDDNSDVFVSEDTENKKPTIDDVIPQPKAFTEYDEVLKDDERIDFPTYAVASDPVAFVNSESNGDFIQKPQKQNKDYKDKIGDLYSDTSKVNPYNKPLEQETISLDSEELFESPKSTFKPNYSNDLESLQNDFAKEGIKLKLYNKTTYVRAKQDNYINYSLLSMIKGWIVWFIMLAEIIITAVILHYNQLLPVAQIKLYYWAGGITLLYPIYYTLAYFIDPYKKIVTTFKLNISLFNKFLAMLINIVFVFAINLFFGMTALNQLSYLSYWLLPIILSSNYIISTLIYFILLKSKKFSI